MSNEDEIRINAAIGKQPRREGALSGAPPEAIRMEFARRLQNAMNERGWTQAEMARRVAPLLKNRRLGRDNISKYVRGKVLPLPVALDAICKVLDLKTSDLLPVRATPVASQEYPPINIRMSPDSDMGWLQINMALPFDTIVGIQQLINDARKKAENNCHA